MTVQKVIEGDELKDRVENKDEDLVENKSENEIREASNMMTIEKHKASEAKEKSEKEDRKESMLVDKHPKAGKKDSNGSSNSKHTEGKDSKRDGQNNNKKGGKEKRNSDQKHDAKQKTSKEMEKKSEEPPKHPGLFLRMKRTKGSKLSLFAESLNEMLQYEMGSRLLDFLENIGQDEKSDLEVKPEKMADKDDTNKKTEDGKAVGALQRRDDKISSLKEDKDVGAKNKLDAENMNLLIKKCSRNWCTVPWLRATLLPGINRIIYQKLLRFTRLA
ncbi:hypothetical protein J5N97_014074 [Dioscorea zingiberensis]|uniref:Uncharacterized protein n=1 Tax=Dioscorea zingiberensis TaxID=325984 RepID=A0A9D5HJ58_9LILI|nr:hypothetical protein J5N97_014074 [Dioscorea zingiberensis]